MKPELIKPEVINHPIFIFNDKLNYYIKEKMVKLFQ